MKVGVKKMALSDRKKKGVGFIIGGLAFVLAGIVIMVTTSSPVWLDVMIGGIGWLGNTLGFVLILPLDTA